MLNRRKLITGLISFVAAPAIVRASSLMPIKAIVFDSQTLLADRFMIDYDSMMKLYHCANNAIVKITGLDNFYDHS